MLRLIPHHLTTSFFFLPRLLTTSPSLLAISSPFLLLAISIVRVVVSVYGGGRFGVSNKDCLGSPFLVQKFLRVPSPLHFYRFVF
ncbi:hypothetical protein Droror1_Dr00017877 [Drosera rotundifolia]